jgi:hypothetical protein
MFKVSEKVECNNPDAIKKQKNVWRNENNDIYHNILTIMSITET